MTPTKPDLLALAQRTFSMEIAALTSLQSRIDEQFSAACEVILACQGRVVVTGMGKSGHVGHKIAATLASTGTPAFFMHPGEASHGDMGMITGSDVVIALSNSGEVPEVVRLLPLIKRLGARLIGISGNSQSSLAQNADVHLFCGVDQEACPLNLAPTSSTTAALVMGDALAVALLEARGFTAQDFAFSHPGGSLGKKLLLKVQDIMHSGAEVPRVAPDTTAAEALLEMTEKGLGMVTIQQQGTLLGIFTDGDLRRTLDRGIDFKRTKIATLMHANPVTTQANVLAAQALHDMQENKITSLVVTEPEHRVLGVVHLHDIIRAGVV